MPRIFTHLISTCGKRRCCTPLVDPPENKRLRRRTRVNVDVNKKIVHLAFIFVNKFLHSEHTCKDNLHLAFICKSFRIQRIFAKSAHHSAAIAPADHPNQLVAAVHLEKYTLMIDLHHFNFFHYYQHDHYRPTPTSPPHPPGKDGHCVAQLQSQEVDYLHGDWWTAPTWLPSALIKGPPLNYHRHSSFR